MTTSVPFYIGKSRDDDTGVLITPPYGTEMPRPFDIRHFWRPATGRDIGGIITLGTLEAMDWLYGATGDIVSTLHGVYDRWNSRVWVQILDPYANGAYWYEATMIEPHVERIAGTSVGTVIVSFRNMERYTA